MAPRVLSRGCHVRNWTIGCCEASILASRTLSIPPMPCAVAPSSVALNHREPSFEEDSEEVFLHHALFILLRFRWQRTRQLVGSPSELTQMHALTPGRLFSEGVVGVLCDDDAALMCLPVQTASREAVSMRQLRERRLSQVNQARVVGMRVTNPASPRGAGGGVDLAPTACCGGARLDFGSNPT